MSISCTGYISFTPSSRHFFSLDSLFQLITTSFPTQMHLPGCVSHFNPLNNFTISHNLTHMPHQFFSVPILFLVSVTIFLPLYRSFRIIKTYVMCISIRDMSLLSGVDKFVCYNFFLSFNGTRNCVFS